MTDIARELHDLACATAREAGALLAERLDQVRTAVSSKSSPTDMVSEVDRESEELIVARILAVRPDDAILAEEGSSRAGTSGVRWVIDPLDGTTNYLYRLPAYAVSIAAEHRGEVVAGAVFDAAHGQLFAAWKGGGATLDDTPITVSSKEELPTALIGTGFGYDPVQRAQQGEVLARILPHVRDIRRYGSAALDLCAVACGRLDGYFELGLGPWDFAAGGLIVREAGGMTHLVEAEGRIRLVVAAGGGVMPGLRQLLVTAGAPFAG